MSQEGYKSQSLDSQIDLRYIFRTLKKNAVFILMCVCLTGMFSYVILDHSLKELNQFTPGDYGYPDAATASYSIYHAQSLGYGSGRDGILLLLSMSNRKYATFVYGDKAEPIFPDAKLIKLENAFLDDFADNDWYDGFSDYLEGCAGILSVDSGEFTWPQFLRRLGISFGIGLLLALIVCQLLKMKMRSVYRQAEASAYVTAEGLNLTTREDVFTHTTTVRRKIERKSDSSSSSDSSSFSGGGGHGRSGSF